jgi:hypothetical protein
VNIGDSYAGSGKGPTGHNGIGDQEQRQGFTGNPDRFKTSTLQGGQSTNLSQPGHSACAPGIPAKNLLLIPERFAIAMQDAGWYVRSRVAWCKKSAMPESVRDRPTSAWEHVWLFSKSPRYFFDAEAVRQSNITPAGTPELQRHWAERPNNGAVSGAGLGAYRMGSVSNGANLRNFWLLGPEPSSLNHYAAFPTEIPRRCILAGTSQRGACLACGAGWVRVVERESNLRRAGNNGRVDDVLVPGNTSQFRPEHDIRGGAFVQTSTTGWRPGCACVDAGEPVAQIVLDPFAGSFTTSLVAERLGRDSVGIELSEKYVEIGRQRLYGDCPMFSEIEVAG